MKQFQVEFEEVACQWLTHISEVTGTSVEEIISNGVYNQISNLEESIIERFTYRDEC